MKETLKGGKKSRKSSLFSTQKELLNPPIREEVEKIKVYKNGVPLAHRVLPSQLFLNTTRSAQGHNTKENGVNSKPKGIFYWLVHQLNAFLFNIFLEKKKKSNHNTTQKVVVSL